MTKPKLAPAKEWRNRPLDTWNTLTFTEHLRDKHREQFGIDYAPFGGTWAMEQGILGDLIGTGGKNPKLRTASNADVKRFIDKCYATYTPSKAWPGTNFGFMWTYRKREWQQIQAESLAEQRAQSLREQAEAATPTDEELAEWF